VSKTARFLFRDADSPVCSLYPYAIRGAQDISLALKSVREKQNAAMWELETAVKPE
jgi:hypothetical protein